MTGHAKWISCSFLFGAAAGAAVSLLFAPQSGWRTRRLVRRKTEEGVDYLIGQGEELADKSREVYDRGKEWANDGARRVERKLKAVAG